MSIYNLSENSASRKNLFRHFIMSGLARYLLTSEGHHCIQVSTRSLEDGSGKFFSSIAIFVSTMLTVYRKDSRRGGGFGPQSLGETLLLYS